ncbi:hypothetical protein AMJ71_02555 [candidate division TA06 bacterium SM1_40]|uniref:FlgD/Vpr Ig-like domain-containing protein n=2 Tax=Bacteria division TA06 TaxID=1156500 RepID=A0A0S8JMG8_UNCT6|nr:MAG: hypothetical protein AMJ82_01080 [candidate division TA06 bacterium SM23_40]KPL10626.1 MAG: hypothetical protein AMJ71_02555 [candidate division TA06 bacterium SM1_40]
MRSTLLLVQTIIVTILVLAATGLGDGYDPTTLVFPPYGHTMGYHKATSFHLRLLLGSTVRFRNPQGVAVVRLRSTDDPVDHHDDDEVSVYAVNSDAHQIVHNRSLTDVDIFGRFGRGEGEFWSPRGIAANADGDVYVADTENHRIVHLHDDGEGLSFAKTIGKFGAAPGEFDRPRGVALDARGTIYVTDTGNHRVQVFSSEGDFVRSIGDPRGGRGRVEHPDGIAVYDGRDQWSFYEDRSLYVVDQHGERIQQFSLDGRLIAAVKMSDIGVTDADIAYLAVDYYGNLYATDMSNHRIHKFDRSLRYIISYGRYGTGDKEFDSPRGIGIWKRFGQVFIVEREGAQYYWVGVDASIRGIFPRTFGIEHSGTTLSLYLTEACEVNVSISDENKNVVRRLVPELWRELGEHEIVWDGLDDARRPVPPGVYRLNVTVEPTYSSKGYFKKELTATVVKVEETEDLSSRG